MCNNLYNYNLLSLQFLWHFFIALKNRLDDNTLIKMNVTIIVSFLFTYHSIILSSIIQLIDSALIYKF